MEQFHSSALSIDAAFAIHGDFTQPEKLAAFPIFLASS